MLVAGFNLADLFERVADCVPERVAVVGGGTRLTYAALDERTTRLAHGLTELGVRPGDHVACYLRTSVAHLEVMLACYKARAVPVNVNDRYVDREVAYVCGDARAVALFHDADQAAHAAAADVDIRVGVATDAYEELLASGSAHRDFPERSGDDHYILYTGGTTGRPKGVVWRHEDIFFAALGGGNPGGPPISTPDEIVDSVLGNPAQRLRAFLPAGDPGPPQFVSLALGPLAHASGQWSALGALLGGGKVVLHCARHVDMDHVVDLMHHEAVNALNVVGDASARPLLDVLEEGRASDAATVRLLGSGGSILSHDVKRRLLAALPNLLAIVEGIGSSESPAQAVSVSTRSGVVPPSLTFAAKPETMIVDDDLHPIPAGTGVAGWLATRGRVPVGYLNDAERSARTFVEIDGARWSLPGDMAIADADGTIRLLGRGSLCINTGGEKVYPEEVEAVLKLDPAVADAVVVGTPDDRFGECVTAIVAPIDQDVPPTLDELRERARPHLAGYKLPRALHLVPFVERSAAGKADYEWARRVAGGS